MRHGLDVAGAHRLIAHSRGEVAGQRSRAVIHSRGLGGRGFGDNWFCDVERSDDVRLAHEHDATPALSRF